MIKPAWNVWRMKKHGGWKVVQTFGKKEAAMKLAQKMKKEFITVRWGKA